jgi:UDP-N-acetylmuramyl pentapeptide phosphotransferase/UDP-N-acetylglucosamine-1-phosphate transferase
MELHSHKEHIEHITVQYPILGTTLLILGGAIGFISLSFEQHLNDINLMLSIFLKLLSIGSIMLSVVIYWDKIRSNSKQIHQDFKDKFQKKKK